MGLPNDFMSMNISEIAKITYPVKMTFPERMKMLFSSLGYIAIRFAAFVVSITIIACVVWLLAKS